MDNLKEGEYCPECWEIAQDDGGCLVCEHLGGNVLNLEENCEVLDLREGDGEAGY